MLDALVTPWDPLHGDGLNFWSGIGSGSPLIAGAIMFWRRHNCHTPWCLRLGKHPVDGTPYVVCRRHHPSVPDKLTDNDIRAAHGAARSAENTRHDQLLRSLGDLHREHERLVAKLTHDGMPEGQAESEHEPQTTG